MKDITKFGNRNVLYQTLITDFGFVKIREKDYPNSGNFFIVLSSSVFLVRYSNDRLFMDVEISSKSDEDCWISVLLLEVYIYDRDNINTPDPNLDSVATIEKANDFLKQNFIKISEMYNETNYPETKRQLGEFLAKRLKHNFPDW